MRLKNKIALVTGGRQGIGLGICAAFVHEGAKVIATGREPRTADLPEGIDWIQVDVSKTVDVQNLTEQVEKQYGKIDVLVNNAGMQIEKTIVDTTDEDWDKLMGVNVKAVFLMCRAFIPHMNEGASIINIGSVSGKVADPSLALYNASKSFVHGLTRSIAVDHGGAVRCNAICPGWIMTGMADAAFALANDPVAAKQDAIARHAVGRFGSPSDVASMAVWLASDESSFATGQCYTLDGGMTASSPLNPGLF